MERTISTTYAPRSTGRSMFARLRLWLDLWSERRTLATLDKRMLADLGIDAHQALREADRPMWDVPPDRDLDGRYGFDR